MTHISVSIILIIHFSVNSVTHFYLLYHRVDLLIKGLSFLVHIYVLIVYSQKKSDNLCGYSVAGILFYHLVIC